MIHFFKARLQTLCPFFALSTFLLFTSITYAASHDEQMHHIAKQSSDAMDNTLSIAVLTYDNMVLQDFSGPVEVFTKASKLTHGKYKVFTVGLNEKSLHTENQTVEITPSYTLDNMPPADYFIIPGAGMKVIESLMTSNTFNKKLMHWKKKETGITVSICTASYLLANTKALNNKQATTHYFVAYDFEKRFPDIDVIKNVRFVDAGDYITSSGVTSGIDVALYIVGKHSGERIKGMIERALQYTYHEEEKWPVAPNGMKYDHSVSRHH